MIKNKKIEHKIYPLLEDLKNFLESDADIVFAYIFGSYGMGKQNPLSDVDIAVYLSSEKDFFEKKLALIGKINAILKTDEVDLVILNEAPLSLQFQVLKTGQLLFTRNKDRLINFKSMVYDLYCDTAPLRAIAEKNLIKRVSEDRVGS